MGRKNHPPHARRVMKKVCPDCRGLKVIEVKTWSGKTEKRHCATCAGRGWVP